MTDEQREKLVKRVAIALGEHFDAVLILTSHLDKGGTKLHVGGCGNYYARVGMAGEYLASEDQKSRDDLVKGLEEADAE